MAAGFRSPSWPLGIAADIDHAGFRSLIAFWAGGACARSIAVPGYRSAFALWAGGAGAEPGVIVTPPPPEPEITGGGVPARRRRRRPQLAPPVIISGYLFAQEAADGFYATGDVYESQAQIDARRRARAMRIILMSS